MGEREGVTPSPLHIEAAGRSCVREAVEFRFEQSGLELLFKPEAFTLDVDRDRIVKQAVEDGAGNHGVAEHLAPGTETLVAGDDDRAALVAARPSM